MRHRALFTCALALLLLPMMAGCDTSGLPESLASTPTAIPQPTATEIALVEPQLNPTATNAPNANTPTTRPQPSNTTPPQPTDTTSVGAQPTDTAGAQDTPAPAATISADKIQEIQQIESETAAFRGLQPLSDVPETFLTEDQLRADIINEMKEDYPRAEAAQDSKELWLMRLSDDPNLDLFQLDIDLQSEQVLGYYDQVKKELFVRNNGSDLSPTARETLAHEYTHALQDQHYDLKKLLPTETTDDDKALAVRSLVEGDATVTGILYAQTHMTPDEYQSIIDESQNADTSVLDSAPRYIRDSLYFPYNEGVEFALALGILQGYSQIDKAFTNPPVSSEQIMHPEKYTSRTPDLPKPAPIVPLTDTLGTGWTHGDNGTLGEFDLKIILEENGAVDGEGAAAGWGGSTYEYYANGDDALMMISTVWDTKRDADEFEDAINETFANYDKDGIILKDLDGQRFFSVKRVNDQITFGASTNSAALEHAMAAIK